MVEKQELTFLEHLEVLRGVLFKIIGIFALLCILAMAYPLMFMSREIMNPLTLISKSLSTSNPTAIAPLKGKNNEFKQIAEMLEEFYMQQEEVKIQNETLVLQSEEIRSINDDLNQQKNDLAEVNFQITDSIKYANRIPLEIIRVFEKHGFIWGGRWYHYDTMHFEYRPEFLNK